MILTQRKVNEIITLVRQRFPNWSGFDDVDFMKDEVTYKQETIAKAGEQLNQRELEQLIAQGLFDEFIKRLDIIGKDNNLLWRSVPLSGDLGILYQNELDKPSFCQAVFDLLYGTDTSHQRLTRYTEYVISHNLPNKWTFPTYFLFICHPDTELFVKPRTTKWFMQFVEKAGTFTAAPTASAYMTLKQIAQELKEALHEYGPRDMIDIQSLIWVCASVSRSSSNGLVSQAKKTEFSALFQEFAQTYPQMQGGQHHIAFYESGRQQGQQNMEQVLQALEGKQDITDLVLLKLLTYVDSESNRQKGAWIHIAPSINGDIKGWYENAGWTKAEDWPRIAQAVLDFARRCVADPEQLLPACREFSALSYSKGFQTGMLTPLLNALRSDEFVLINNKSRRVINYFANTKYSQKLVDYPATNATAYELLDELSSCMDHPAISGLSIADRFDMFCHWLVAEKRYSFGSTAYWKIAPGEGAWNWDACHEGGFIAMGWDELGDMSGISKKEFDARVNDLLKKHPDWGKGGIKQVWRFVHDIKEGDRIIANHGISQVLGIGTVVGQYEFVPGSRHGHRLPVEWNDLAKRTVKQQGWRRTLVKLRGTTFRKVSTAPVIDDEPIIDVVADCPFSKQTFELLTGLHNNPKKDYYLEHKEGFETHLTKPFQSLLYDVAAKLPSQIKSVMETQKRIFGRILKNDFGQGGAWDFYWGAFYPKDGKRIEDAQLSMWINYELFEVGFYIGQLKNTQRNRFVRNCQTHYDALVHVVQESISEKSLLFGGHDDIVVRPDGIVTSKLELSWKDWLKNPEQVDFDVSFVLSRHQVLQYSANDLIEKIVQIYIQLFPLVLVATLDDPIPAIVEYLEPSDGEFEQNPNYTLTQCAEDTGFDENTLARWVRAIDRKGQAILYGPPGTSKTYMAELLAKHLVSNGDGFVEFVQFHPAYAYEDFVQGIRPQERSDGGLTYPVVEGRFLAFCKKARKRQETCVLIIDEINRANLSRVFGELMYLLEYRNRTIPLAAGGTFSIPHNVRIIGTMNTADRSIALVDHALRRRFAFITLAPNYDVLCHYHQQTGFAVDGLIKVLQRLNVEIDDSHYAVGITFFLNEHLAANLEDIWRMEIEPYLEEYFFDQRGKVQAFRWSKIENEVRPG